VRTNQLGHFTKSDEDPLLAETPLNYLIF